MAKTLVVLDDPSLDLLSVEGRLIAHAKAIGPAKELERIKARIRDSHAERRYTPQWHGGTPPYGYTTESVVLDGGTVRRVLVLDEYTCSVAHEMRRWMVEEGETLMGVARRLNDRGELTGSDLWRRRKKMPLRNELWSSTGVKMILTSPSCLGVKLQGRKPMYLADGSPFKIAHPLFDADDVEWETLQAAIAARTTQRTRKWGASPLLDVVFCGLCGAKATRNMDDHLLGFTGPKAEAEQVKECLAQFLREDLKLELSQDKTLITHARTQAASFLGYEITVQHSQHRPLVNGVVRLRVPQTVIKAKCAPYLKHGQPEYRPELMNRSDDVIISTYGAEFRGLVQYYLLAGDVSRLHRLRWIAETSMLKTLAAKHDSTVTSMARKYKATIATPHGPHTCFETRVERAGRKPLVARFGGIPLKRQKKAVLDDRRPVPITIRRKELITRLQADRCEWCQRHGPVQTHQVRKLADLDKPGRPQPAWEELVARMRRKTLLVCADCHKTIHSGQPTAVPTE